MEEREKGRRRRSLSEARQVELPPKERIRERERERERQGKNGELVTPGSPRPGLDNRDVFRAKNRPGTRVSRALVRSLALVGCVCAFSLWQRRCSRPRGSERRSPAIFRPRNGSGVGVSLDTSFDALTARRHGHLRAAREQVSSGVSASLLARIVAVDLCTKKKSSRTKFFLRGPEGAVFDRVALIYYCNECSYVIILTIYLTSARYLIYLIYAPPQRPFYN